MKKRLTFVKFFSVLSCLAMSLTASTCGSDDDPEGGNNTSPNVAVSGTAEDVGTDYAVINGQVNLEGISANYSSVEFGVEYSMYDDFSPYKREVATSLVGRTFTVEISDLSSKTQYYYRTYVHVPSLSYDYFGKTRDFTTSGGGGGGSDTPSGSGRYVDLGLTSGTLWATMNVGAKKPEQYGNYYAWGETKPKDNYTWSTYRWYDSVNSGYYPYFTKYTGDNNGNIDKITLDANDDAAYAHPDWGEEWRMPTQAQLDELIRECEVSYEQRNGVWGYLFSRNNKSVFFPFAGYWSGAAVYSTESYANYWSRTLNDKSFYYSFAWSLSEAHLDSQQRYYGLPVRAVYVGK